MPRAIATGFAASDSTPANGAGNAALMHTRVSSRAKSNQRGKPPIHPTKFLIDR